MSLSVVVAITVTLVVVLIIGRIVSDVRKQQRRRDDEVLLTTVADPTKSEISYYKKLPNYASRVNWLDRHYPEFMKAARRADLPVAQVVAYCFDFRLIPNMTPYLHPQIQMREYLTDYKWNPLSMYEKEMVEYKDKRDREEARISQMRAEGEAIEAERQKKREAAEKARKAAAGELWASLSEEGKEAFKNAKGIDERKKSLGVTDFNGFSVNVLYTLLMGQEFPEVRSSHPDSICVAEQASTTHSSDHGGFSYHDGGSTHTHTDTGSHSSFDGGFHVSDGGGGFCH